MDPSCSTTRDVGVALPKHKPRTVDIAGLRSAVAPPSALRSAGFEETEGAVMAKVFVEGDHEALDHIRTALRSAGLSGVDVELLARTPELRRLPAAPGHWAAYADLGADLTYADWRDEVLSFVPAEHPGPLRSAPARNSAASSDLRRAG